MKSGQKQIEATLAEMKTALNSGKLILVPRKKNRDTLSRMGMMWSDVKDEMLSLSVSNYISGPDVDRDNPSSEAFWKFKMKIESHTIYIKFKILYETTGSVKVVSFHIDDYE